MPTLQLTALLFLAAFLAIWWCCKSISVKCPQRNVAGPPSNSWFTGNMMQLAGLEFPDFTKAVFKKYGGVAKIRGMCGNEHLFVSDPLALRELLGDPSLLLETPIFVGLFSVLFGQCLLSVHGVHHRKQRKILNPLFSPNHIRSLFPTISRVASEMTNQMEDKIIGGENELDINDICWRTAAETIGQVGFGYSFGALNGSSHVYLDSVKNLFPVLDKLGLAILFLPALLKIGTPRFRQFVLDPLPWGASQAFRHILDVITQTSHEILSARKSELELNGKDNLATEEKSIITRLLQANNDTSEEDRLSVSEVQDQINMFTFAGAETTGSTLSLLLAALARKPTAQNKLRGELMEAGHARVMSSFEALNLLPFLDAVVKETLRLYPTAVKWKRTASRDITVSLRTPITGTDGQLITQIAVAKNQTVIIGIAECNSDPSIWGPDAGEWKPERWLEQLPESLISARVPGLYSHLMSFLGGERACIGYNLAIMEIKTMLATLVLKFHFETTDAEVEWKASFARFPLVKGETQPRLPLHVSLV